MLLLFAAVCVLALLAGCGGEGEDPQSPPTDSEAGSEGNGLPPTSDGPETGALTLEAFADRCLGVTESVEDATIRFDDSPTMRLDETSEYLLRITPQDTADDDLEAQGSVLVTCTIDARLVISTEDAAVSPSDWQTVRYLPPDPAEWAWLVTPARAGTVEASLEVRPILVVGEDGEAATTEYATTRFGIDIAVEQGLWDRIASLTTQAQALLALVTAVGALAVALGIRRWGPPVWHRVRGRTTSEPGAPPE